MDDYSITGPPQWSGEKAAHADGGANSSLGASGGGSDPQPQLEAALQLIAQRTQYITNATGAAIALKEGVDLVCRAATGSTAPDRGARLEIRTGLTAECIRSGELLRCDNAENDPRVDLESCRRLGIESIIVMPLYHRNVLVGIFELFAPHAYSFQERDVETLKGMAEMVSVALTEFEAARRAVKKEEPSAASASPNSPVSPVDAGSDPTNKAGKTPAVEVCNSCGALVDANSVICSRCGVPIAGKESAKSAGPQWPWRQNVNAKRLAIPSVFVALALLVAFAPIHTHKNLGEQPPGEARATSSPAGETAPANTAAVGTSGKPAATTPTNPQAPAGSPAGSPQPGVSASVKELLGGVSSDFSKLLPTSQKGDAEPDVPVLNADVKVWVDTRKGYYYCPGDDQYGRTSRGTYMTQREAQADYYIPALMKPCP